MFKYPLILILSLTLLSSSACARPQPVKNAIKKGLALYKQGEYEKAIEAFEEAVTLAPDFVAARYNLAINYLSAEDIPNAEKEQKAIKGLDKELADILLELIDLRKELQEAYDNNISL